MKLYKYCPSSILHKVFAEDDLINVKCSLPKDYNDPFELFLSVNVEEQYLSVIPYYLEILGEIPQMPTTCFSKRPDVIPMWAHYGDNHRGFVIEIDEVEISNTISIGYIDDVTYAATTGNVDLGIVAFAAGTLKPRHTHKVQTIAFRNAYFTKNKCWEYEAERRLVLNPEDVKNIAGIMLLQLPMKCASRIIYSANSPKEDIDFLQRKSKQYAFDLYQMQIGKSSCYPYFISQSGKSFLFNDNQIVEAATVCEDCKEPLYSTLGSKCNWCATTQELKNEAALSNPFRLYNSIGFDHGYRFHFDGMTPIGRYRQKSDNSV